MTQDRRTPVLRARTQLQPGARLRVQFYGDGGIKLVDEEVLPERVYRVDVGLRKVIAELMLGPDDVRWLHGVLGEWIAATAKDPP